MAASAGTRLGKVTAAWELPCHFGWAMAVTPCRTSLFLSIRDILRVTPQSRETGEQSPRAHLGWGAQFGLKLVVILLEQLLSASEVLDDIKYMSCSAPEALLLR